MRFWFDTEFIEDGRTIDLLSIGIVAEDGRTYYAEPLEADWSRASPWVQENVIPFMEGKRTPRKLIADQIKEFCGEKPVFWAYYADYDWVALCQLYGTMMDLPEGWPKYCRDVKQLADSIGNPIFKRLTGQTHHALDDALWVRDFHVFLEAENQRLRESFVFQTIKNLRAISSTALEGK